MVSSAVQRLSLIRSHVFIFTFISFASGDRAKKKLLQFISECSLSRTILSSQREILHLLSSNSTFPTPPSPWQSPLDGLSLWIWQLQVPHVSEFIQWFSFCVSLILSVGFSCIHTVLVSSNKYLLGTCRSNSTCCSRGRSDNGSTEGRIRWECHLGDTSSQGRLTGRAETVLQWATITPLSPRRAGLGALAAYSLLSAWPRPHLSSTGVCRVDWLQKMVL